MSDHPNFQTGNLFEKRLLCFETAVQDAFGEFRRIVGELDAMFRQEITDRVKEYGEKEIDGWRKAYGDMEQQKDRLSTQVLVRDQKIQVLKTQIRRLVKAKKRTR